MSTQSILTKTIYSIQENSEKILLDNADNYILKKRFALGKGMKIKETEHAVRLLGFLCTENCELIAYLNNIIEGKSELEVQEPICKNGYIYSTISDYTEIFEENLI